MPRIEPDADDRPDPVAVAGLPGFGTIRLDVDDSRRPDPFRQLAAAVVRQAARDAVAAHMYTVRAEAQQVRIDALQWLHDEHGAGLWLAWLGVDWSAYTRALGRGEEFLRDLADGG